MKRSLAALDFLWILVPLAVTVGALFWPPVGILLPALILFAAISTLFSRRWFCRVACPRAHWLPPLLGKISRRKTAPAFLRSPGLRGALAVFMLICSVGQLRRLWGYWDALGLFFQGMCLLTLAAALVLGIIFRPRAWCLPCPMGALQDWIRPPPKAEAAEKRKGRGE